MKNKWWKLGLLIGIIVAVLVIDIVTKYVFDAKYEIGEEVTIIPSIINFSIVHNYGAAWGILAGKQAFLVFVAVFFIVIFTWYYIKEKHKR